MRPLLLGLVMWIEHKLPEGPGWRSEDTAGAKVLGQDGAWCVGRTARSTGLEQGEQGGVEQGGNAAGGSGPRGPRGPGEYVNSQGCAASSRPSNLSLAKSHPLYS